jgi:hypothetical protein
VGKWDCGVTTRLLVVGLAATVLILAGAFLLGLTAASLGAAVGLDRLFGLGRLPGDGHFWLFGASAGSVYIAVGSLAPRTSPPSLADRRCG